DQTQQQQEHRDQKPPFAHEIRHDSFLSDEAGQTRMTTTDRGLPPPRRAGLGSLSFAAWREISTSVLATCPASCKRAVLKSWKSPSAGSSPRGRGHFPSRPRP